MSESFDVRFSPELEAAADALLRSAGFPLLPAPTSAGVSPSELNSVAAEQPAMSERHSACLLAGQQGPSAPISLLSNEGRCVQCISTTDGPALCRRGL